MKSQKNFSSRREFFAWAKAEFPRGDIPEAAWARSLVSSWRCWCGKVGRSPDDTGDVRRTAAPTAAEAEEARHFREEAARQAQIAKSNGSSFSLGELVEAWLAACHNRAPDGRLYVGE